jgi:hypothetical protein
VTINRLIDIYEELARRGHLSEDTPTLCVVAAEYLDVRGAGIAILPQLGPMAAFCTSNDVAKELMDLEVTLGEGPCQDACSSVGVIAEPDLRVRREPRWLSYGPLASAAGARAVFGIPVRIGAIRIGALSLFDDRPGALSDAKSSDAYLMASVVGKALLSLQAGTPPDSIADELVRQSTFDFSVHQAAGMVAVQGAFTVGEALARLRAHAFVLNVTASALASRVVFRELVFDAISREWVETGTSTR